MSTTESVWRAAAQTQEGSWWKVYYHSTKQDSADFLVGEVSKVQYRSENDEIEVDLEPEVTDKTIRINSRSGTLTSPSHDRKYGWTISIQVKES